MFERLWEKVDQRIPFGLSKTELWVLLVAIVTVLAGRDVPYASELLDWMRANPIDAAIVMGGPTALFLKDASRKAATRIESAEVETMKVKRYP